MVQLINNHSELEEIMNEAPSDSVIVVDFYATWCGPCKNIAPKIEQLEKDHENVIFLKVDVDASKDLTEHHEVTAMPTFLFFKNKIKVDKVVGGDFNKIKQTVEKHK